MKCSASESSSNRKPNILDWSRCVSVSGGRSDYAMKTYAAREDVEERLVGVVVEVGRDGMEPYDAFSGLDVNETEPVVLLDARPLADTKGSVGVDGDSVPAEHQHSPEASEAPGIC